MKWLFAILTTSLQLIVSYFLMLVVENAAPLFFAVAFPIVAGIIILASNKGASERREQFGIGIMLGSGITAIIVFVTVVVLLIFRHG